MLRSLTAGLVVPVRYLHLLLNNRYGRELLFYEFIERSILEIVQYGLADFLQSWKIFLQCCEYCIFINIGILVCYEVPHSENRLPGNGIVPFEKIRSGVIPHLDEVLSNTLDAHTTGSEYSHSVEILSEIICCNDRF